MRGRPNHHQGLTYAEIGELLGMSRARVQQIEVQALRKLKKLLAQRDIRDSREVLP